MECVSLGEWGQVQEETNFHWHKRASDESGAAQQRGGILRPHENPGGKSTGIKTLEVFHIPNLYIFHTARYFTAGKSMQGCVHDLAVRLALKGMVYHAKIIIILVGTYVF